MAIPHVFACVWFEPIRAVRWPLNQWLTCNIYLIIYHTNVLLSTNVFVSRTNRWSGRQMEVIEDSHTLTGILIRPRIRHINESVTSIITDVISALSGLDSIFYNDSSWVAGISRFWRWMVLNSPGSFLLHQKTVEYKDTGNNFFLEKGQKRHTSVRNYEYPRPSIVLIWDWDFLRHVLCPMPKY